MPANFDDAIPFFGNWVAASGPEHPKEKIKEICVWVYQSLPDGAGDAAATEMTTHNTDEDHPPHFLQVEGERWLLPVKRISTAGFRNGRAFAVALALLVERDAEEKERVVWWGQPVELQENEDLVTIATEAVEAAANARDGADAVLREGGRLADPLPFNGEIGL